MNLKFLTHETRECPLKVEKQERLPIPAGRLVDTVYLTPTKIDVHYYI